MNNITNIDINSLPNSLREYESICVLGQIIADYLNDVSKDIDKAIIFPRIDELSEGLLDVIAYDLHIDWYDYGYTVEQKREVIKTSINVHRKLGTRYAIETALNAVYGNSSVVPWFDCGGEPYSFEVTLDTSESDKAVRFDEVADIVNYYKSLRDSVSRTEFITRDEKKVSCAVIPVTSISATLSPEYDDINVGNVSEVWYTVYAIGERSEVIDCEIITPATGGGSSNSGNTIYADMFVEDGTWLNETVAERCFTDGTIFIYEEETE